MNKSKVSLYFIFIAFLTFSAIFLTIIQSSYNNLVNPTKQIESDKYLEPLDPVLDSEIIQEIEKRQAQNDDQQLRINNLNENIIDKTNIPNDEILTTPTPDSNLQPILSEEDNN